MKVEAAQQKAQVKQVTQQINEFMESHSIQLNFSVDQELSQIVVKVREKHTGKLIRQIPSEEALRLSKTMEALQGMLIKHKA
jgi:flagellar protein FlaG